jgi:hypothetical protein
MSNKDFRVAVKFVDGTWVEFYAFDSYETAGEGEICMWQDVVLDGKSLDFYSIPTRNIKEIQETDLTK